ncbi:helix-turn-helix domain-containing protein [Arthrobacter rhombi]|uniref:helix-turn-helix domain-containing protein n=1 Tax=Arthrobacter rhombi TaxID=71253 RepID=UPI003F900112
MRLEDVAEELSVNMPQVRSLVRSGELPAIKVGGRGVWRVERSELEAYIERQYVATREGLKQDGGISSDGSR